VDGLRGSSHMAPGMLGGTPVHGLTMTMVLEGAGGGKRGGAQGVACFSGVGVTKNDPGPFFSVISPHLKGLQ